MIATSADDELNFHLEIVLSNLRDDVGDRILRATSVDELREKLHDSFYTHPPGCQGGYSEERCPCAWAAKGLHTMFAIIEIDKARWGDR